MKGVFVLTHPAAIPRCLLSELNRQQGWLGCPRSSLSSPQGTVGAASYCLPLLSSLALQKWSDGFEGQNECRSLLRRKDPARCEHPTVALGYLRASISLLTVILPDVKKRRGKWGWAWGSQTSLLFHGWGKSHPNFSLEGQDAFAFLSLLRLKWSSCDWEGVLERHCL